MAVGYMSCNPCITRKIVKANVDKPWDWTFMSINPSTDWEFVQANPDKPWNWHYLSKKPRMLISKEDESRIGLIRRLVTRYPRLLPA